MMKKILSKFLFFVFLLSSSAFCFEPTKKPILRIETGMHNAVIWRIGIDSKNRYIVTGSWDKTVRVWELFTGRLLKTLRPPIGEGNEGKIYAVDISPDGNTIACGGWTGWEWDRSHYVYFFDRRTGRLVDKISGLPNVIDHLAYSKDGRFIVLCLGGKNGIRVYRVSDLKLVAQDKNYGDNINGADFDFNGRLVTTSYDGYIRLYDKDFRLISKRKAFGGKRPYHISFSPDGEKIAVGFDDSTNIDVLSGKDLTYLYSPNTKGVNNGNLFSVTWSYDGKVLYSGGRYWGKFSKGFFICIRKWVDEGRGSYVDIPVSKNTIMQILPLRNGGVIFGTWEPSFGVLDSYDRKVIYKTPTIPDFRDGIKKFLVSYDGFKVQFGYRPWGKSPAVFSVIDRSLEIISSSSSGVKLYDLHSPILSAKGLSITNWRNTTNPKLNGRPIKLEKHEISRSISISPKKDSFLLGTEWYLRLFDRHGNRKWKVSVPSAVWDVNISGNGKVAVAAIGDGTIRWYRMSDGKEILALFPHIDKKRWILWTPSGYYDASADGENLIGWHVNNGKSHEADFYPISSFRDRFYRPQVIASLTRTLDESKALRVVSRKMGRKSSTSSILETLPPVVHIISPEDGEVVQDKNLKVIFRVKSQEPILKVRTFINGRPIEKRRGIGIRQKDKDIYKITVRLSEYISNISIIAVNRHGVSQADTVKVILKKMKRKDFVIKPKLYILAVGVSKYLNKDLQLTFPSKDVVDFVKVMKRQKGLLYRNVVAKVITDEKATKGEILDGLDWIQRETTSKDVAMIFFAGHGINDYAGIYYFLPADVNLNKLKRTALAFSDIKNTVSCIAGKVLVFMDTCHSGNVMGARRGVADINGVINELSSAENGAVVFASSTGKQYSLEDLKWGNGAFTKALVEGLSGKADYTGKGEITVKMLDLYLSEKVKELTRGRQTPTTIIPKAIGNFPIAVIMK